MIDRFRVDVLTTMLLLEREFFTGVGQFLNDEICKLWRASFMHICIIAYANIRTPSANMKFKCIIAPDLFFAKNSQSPIWCFLAKTALGWDVNLKPRASERQTLFFCQEQAIRCGPVAKGGVL